MSNKGLRRDVEINALGSQWAIILYYINTRRGTMFEFAIVSNNNNISLINIYD